MMPPGRSLCFRHRPADDDEVAGQDAGGAQETASMISFDPSHIMERAT